MKKSFMNNIKNFVDSNVRQRIDRAANHNNNDFFGDDLLLVERQFEDIRYVCVEAEKKISSLLQSLSSPTPLGTYTQNVQTSLNNLAGGSISSPNPTGSYDVQSSYRVAVDATTIHWDQPQTPINTSAFQHLKTTSATETLQGGDMRRHKKLPIFGFLKFLSKSRYKLKPDSLLATTLTHCSQIQAQLTQLYLAYEQTIESQCLQPIRQILEIDVPNVMKLRKLFIKSHNDLESVKAKYNGASVKQQQQLLQSSHSSSSTSYTISQTNVQQVNINKLDQLKRELDEAECRFEQAKDTYAAELYAFVSKEGDLAAFFLKFYECQTEYHQQISNVFQRSLPPFHSVLANTPRKIVFGTPLEEILGSTGRTVSHVIELCIHLLYSTALKEEGLFRIPGSSIKIKKLKNAINAWFVSLANYNDLESSHQVQRGGDDVATIAIHELFKDIVGLRSESVASSLGTGLSNNTCTTSSLTLDSESPQQAKSLASQIVFDVHAIAGLLKLYLRELPDPLLTHNLYSQWIEAVKTMYEGDLTSIELVIKQMPRANYDNLRHLIRFLHLLTCHSESNKMTATNLAITMAPSLIWTKPVETHPCSSERLIPDGQNPVELQLDEMQALSAQMSNVGLSASLHALIVENLISHAEKLFPGPVQFALPSLDLNLSNNQASTLKYSRGTKSTSPTGISTASSSSVSSASITSPPIRGRHSRKGGSMEGLLGRDMVMIGADKSPGSPIRKQSMQPPPIPPAPSVRSQSKQTSDTICSNKQVVSASKPPTPSVPPQNTSNRQQFINQKLETSSDKVFDCQTSIHNEAPSTSDRLLLEQKALSFRPTSSPTPIASNKSTTGRPTVPPPNRPMKETTNDGPSFVTKKDQPVEIDDRNSQSLSSSELLRADYEEIHTVDMEDISAASISSVVSLDSFSAEDSSFDQDSHSLENSWTECDHDPNKAGSSGLQKTHLQAASAIGLLCENDLHELPESQSAKTETATLDTPPVKPPRCLSPRVTQSTPL